MSEINVNEKNFDSEVLKADKPVLVDFFATWCSPCFIQSPIVTEIADEYNNKIKVCKIDIDENEELARKYNISSIPTLIFFENGEIKKTSIGLSSKENLEKIINEL